MTATAKRTVSLPQEQAAYIDAKVAAGDYASVRRWSGGWWKRSRRPTTP